MKIIFVIVRVLLLWSGVWLIAVSVYDTRPIKWGKIIGASNLAIFVAIGEARPTREETDRVRRLRTPGK